MSTILQRILGRSTEGAREVLQWESRLSFDHAQVDRFLLKNILQDTEDIARARTFLVDCLSLEYDAWIPMQQEIDRVQRYVEVLQYQKESLYVSLSIDFKNSDLMVRPLLLLPLLQNAVQTTYFMSDTRPIKCKINEVNHVLQMEVSNRVNPYLQSQSETECMRFFRSRLAYCYQDRYELLINSNSNLFKVTLRLQL